MCIYIYICICVYKLLHYGILWYFIVYYIYIYILGVHRGCTGIMEKMETTIYGLGFSVQGLGCKVIIRT